MAVDAETVTISGSQSFIRSFLGQISSQQKTLLILASAAIVALVAGGWMWGRAPDYRVLFSNISDHDGGAIIAALQQMNVPYKFADGGGAILVPESQVHDARLKLAAQGLPKGGLVGFELMENQKFGTSQFLEQVNFNRAVEGELARSIQSLSAVSSARVHLAIPKQSVFMREQPKPTASVLVNLHPGRTLDPQQVSAVAHLVSSSVPNLQLKNVTLVDQHGNLLSRTDESGANNGLDASQLKYVQAVERSYIERIEAILSPIVGAENVRAQVAADVDFAQSEHTSEIYKPNQNPADSAVRSQQISESSMRPGTGEGGVPGALSNQPPVPATAPVTTPPGTPADPPAPAVVPPNTRKDATTNYEVDKTVQHVRKAVGSIKRMSVAVVVNYRRVTDQSGATSAKPLTEAEKAQVTDLVKEAMGFNSERGDTLNVVNSPFADQERETVPELPLWKQPEVVDLARQIGKMLLLGGLILYLILGVVRPTLKRINQPPAPLLTAAQADEDVPIPEVIPAERQAPPALSQHEQNLTLARQLAKDDPKRVANVVKQWVVGE